MPSEKYSKSGSPLLLTKRHDGDGGGQFARDWSDWRLDATPTDEKGHRDNRGRGHTEQHLSYGSSVLLLAVGSSANIGDPLCCCDAHHRGLSGLELLPQVPQINDHLTGALIPIRRILRQALVDEELQLSRHACANARERVRFFVNDLVEQRLVVQALERPLTADHLVEHAPKRPNVGAVIDPRALGLLRAHVGNSTQRRVELRQLRTLGQQGQPEVQHGNVALVVDDDVGGFDVAVHDILFVSSLQSLGDLLANAECIRNLQRSLVDAPVEAFTFDELHGDEAAAFDLIDFVDATDVRMTQRRGGLLLLC